MSTPDISGVPAGPIQAAPAGFRVHDEQAAILRDTLTAAGIELGEYERNIVDWLSMWEWATVAVICSWLARAVAGRPPVPAVALPSRFAATPAEVDQHLRRILAEDTYVRFQQAIGRQAVAEAAQGARDHVEGADIPGSPVSSDYVKGWLAGADHLDPTKDGGPYPSQLQCSQHDGFGPCPGAPRCTPKENS